MKKLGDIFDALDEDQNGSLTMAEFEEWTNAPQLRAFFEDVLVVETGRVNQLFKILDVAKDGLLEREEFIVGCMRFQAGSKNHDSEVQMHLIRVMAREVKMVRSSVLQIQRDIVLWRATERQAHEKRSTLTL